MRFLPRFKLRTLLISIALISVALGVSVNYIGKRIAQRQNVASLEEIGGQFHARQGSYNKIQVWYDDDLRWNENENRFEIAFSFGKPDGLVGWIERTFGRDFIHSPVALEISCHDFDADKWEMVSNFDDEMIDQIKQLPTLRQLWITTTMDADGRTLNITRNSDLKKHFPDLIIASAQPN